ncbi:Sua5/YciO/YrdC/YwlC family protein [Moraxella sp. ZJ142]|uniref:Sua5/YciO/YrdC/YwlC family protein n=1 Tax=Moraxella marmotae TaxID=3344520 RepID=UPI0035D4537F
MQIYYPHPDNPQARIITQIAKALQNDQLLVYPDIGGYRLAMSLNAKQAFEQACRMAQSQELIFCLICRDLSQIANYAQVSNFAHRILKKHLGQNIDFMLPATKTTPKKYLHAKHQGIAVRTANTPLSLALLDELGEAFVSLPIILGGEQPIFDGGYELQMLLENLVDGFVDGGDMNQSATAIINLINDEIVLLNQGEIDMADL